jgi:hypothetical protein
MDKDMILMPLTAKMSGAGNVIEAKKAKKESATAPEGTGADVPSSVRTSSDFDFLKHHFEAVAESLGTSWALWQRSYMVTLPFPTGAVCSATMPPSPNTPVPVSAGLSAGDIAMSEPMLKVQMRGMYKSPERHPKMTDAFLGAMASAIALSFTQWKSSTQITNVMGAGGVAPAPPLPPGPVAGAMGSGGKLV